MELYRYLIDNFLIEYCRNLNPKDFTAKTEKCTRKRAGRREYLNDTQTKGLIKALNCFFDAKVDIPRIRVGRSQSIETLITEEVLLFAKYLRMERENWVPRSCSLAGANNRR